MLFLSFGNGEWGFTRMFARLIRGFHQITPGSAPWVLPEVTAFFTESDANVYYYI